ncbi:inhibitor of growth protein 3-like [Halichondria panicea]|uniref:inhibitor of growth protein 3-like n=1 Tax=Halichondria panicea TaxID=6063 RepID=UPI00312B5EDC
MHYLEDYLEIIEFLPAELKSRLMQIKDLDECVQGQLENLRDKNKTFFSLCRKSNKPDLRDQQYNNICQEYEKSLEDSAEKVKIANQLYDMIDRHMKRLDQDLSRFTIELEADTGGITEILEQKSYLLDRPPTPEKPSSGQKRSRNIAHLDDHLSNGEFDDFTLTSSIRASPAPVGRTKYPRREHRTSASFSLHTDLDSDILDLDDQLSPPSSFYAGTGGKPPLSFSLSDPKPPKRGSFSQTTSIFSDVDGEPGGDWIGFVDPNEPRYCLCNQVSYGEMVGCDNPECSIEWFHYGCVGITEPPKGKWYCPQCSSIKKKGGRRL